jgi:N6-L-threonylcarbamoyladenine synthase
MTAYLLAIESTCDETAAAVIDGDRRVLSSVVATQTDLHAKFQGVVPEIAARAHLERALPVVDEALRNAEIGKRDLSAIAVANGPGLAGSLLVGVSVAKGLAIGLGVPLIGVDHLHAHIYACRMAAGRDIFPCVGLVVSGGHTHLYRCDDPLNFTPLGGTIDDAAGEAFDKVASMLSLPFPGGPALARLAEQGDPKAFRFPRSFLHEERLDFSFSGVKTAVRYEIAGPGQVDFAQLEIPDQRKADIAASFEAAVVDCLVAKSVQATAKTGLARLCVGGGVAANRKLRANLTEACAARGIDLVIAPPDWCTDNAAMGAVAIERWKHGRYDDLDLDVLAGLFRPDVPQRA